MHEYIERRFDELWIQHADYLLEREQTALLRCRRDAPAKVLGLFWHFIERSIGRLNIQVLLESDIAVPALVALPARRCISCGGPNFRKANKQCYWCYRAAYLVRLEARSYQAVG